MLRLRSAILAVLACWLLGAAPASGETRPRLVPIPGLGPLLLFGPTDATAFARYRDRVIAQRPFDGKELGLRSVAVSLTGGSAPTLATLRASGKPVIGIQLNHLQDLTGRASSTGALLVAKRIARAGGTPVFLPPASARSQIGSLLSSIDHLVLLGGDDVHPSLYGEKVTHARGLKLERDRYEVALVKRAMARGIGIDGICRGMQLLNVAAGGSLYQDIYLDGATKQRHSRPRFQLKRHRVQLEPGSESARAIGSERVWAHSVHHQAVREPGRGLCVAGRSCDGLAEVIEGRQVRGYQFHPERSENAASKAIFRDLVSRARQHQSRH